MTQNILEIENLSVSYGAVSALRDVSLVVPAGAIVCLIGANGAGKTTVLRTVSGLKRADKGSLRFRDIPIQRTPPHVLVRLGLVHCPEGRGIFPNLSVEDNLSLGAYVRKDHAAIKLDFEQVYTLFPRLLDRRGQVAGTLSGGEQQMLAIGRALMARPQLLLLDEPSLGLAPQLVESIFATIQKINQQGTSILLVEQNAHLALEIAQWAYVLETGNLVLHGAAAKVAGNSRVKTAYLGE